MMLSGMNHSQDLLNVVIALGILRLRLLYPRVESPKARLKAGGQGDFRLIANTWENFQNHCASITFRRQKVDRIEANTCCSQLLPDCGVLKEKYEVWATLMVGFISNEINDESAAREISGSLVVCGFQVGQRRKLSELQQLLSMRGDNLKIQVVLRKLLEVAKSTPTVGSGVLGSTQTFQQSFAPVELCRLGTLPSAVKRLPTRKQCGPCGRQVPWDFSTVRLP
jgi:hypothetical protein